MAGLHQLAISTDFPSAKFHSYRVNFDTTNAKAQNRSPIVGHSPALAL